VTTIDSQGTPRFHGLDGLRAVAVTLVLSHHFLTSALATELVRHHLTTLAAFLSTLTRSGVELFFVLSAVVLLRPYLRGERKMALLRFYSRRVQRLWPPYLAALFLAGLVIWFNTVVPTWYSREVWFRFSPRDWGRQILMFNFGWPTYNVAWWSLTIELLFYVVAPLLVLWLTRVGVGRRRYTLLVVAALLVGLMVNFSGPVPEPGGDRLTTLRLALTYAPCFAIGCAIAARDFDADTGATLVAVGAAVLFVTIVQPVFNVHAAYALVYGGAVILAMSPTTPLRLLETFPLVWLGERSYSLFLTHFSALYAADNVAALFFPARVTSYFLLSRALGLVLALFATLLVFCLVERRFAKNLATAKVLFPWQSSVSSLVRRDKPRNRAESGA